MVKYIPQRGDILWLEFEPQQGKEILKRRPALVISPLDYNKKVGLALCLPITSQVKGYPFEVVVNTPHIQGAILCDQVKSLDWDRRKASFIERASREILKDALAKLKLLIEEN
jgi:mRNA interferase MazF